MRRKLLSMLIPLIAAAVAAAACLTAYLCLGPGGGPEQRTAAVILAAAAVAAAAILTAAVCLGRLVRPVDPDAEERPDWEELEPLLRRLDEQKAALRVRREELEDKENKLTAITENMTEGLALLDGSGAVLVINAAALRLLGGEADAVGRHISAVNADNRLQASAHQAIGGSANREILALNGRKIQVVANPVLVDGAARGAVLMFIDVTERVAAEEMRREFSANVSHELKTPITTISGYAELMKAGLSRPEDVPELAGKIYAEARRLIDLISDIIRLSRLDESAGTFPTEEVELLSAAEAACARLESRARALEITVAVSGEPERVRGDAQLIDEMITNLCDNGVKYNHPGGHVWVRVSRENGAPVLSVEDDGIGIAPEHLDRVFERFYRGDKSRSKETGGTGLGLSIVKHAAAWHRAELRAESVPGRGTRISIVFNGKGG